MSFIYLASPYSNKDATVRSIRYWAAVCKAAELMQEGAVVFSPIAHTHAIGMRMNREMDHDFWLRQDLALLQHASALYVLRLEGWLDSVGVNREIRYAVEHGIPVEYVDP